MGQQQLLLVILVTILIGIATVVAIDTMQQAQSNSSESAIRQDILMVINDAQIYYKKPNMMNGGSNSFDGISKDNIMSIETENENGNYEISGSGNTLTVTGTSTNENIEVTATAKMTSAGLEIDWSNS